MDLRLDTADLGLVATTAGGAVWRFFAKREGREVPLFREPPASPARAALQSGCFPLVPFGNRVRGNWFGFESRDHSFTPNMPWDRHYLHGDGWTGDWQVLEHAPDRLRLGFEHRGGPGTPYSYTAEQFFVLEARTLTLNVTNAGEVALPVDVEAKAQIYAIVRELAAAGRSVIFVSSEIEELPRVCDRVLVLRGGRLTQASTAPDIRTDALMAACL